MRIVVCIKFVPDTAIKVKVAPDKKWVDLSDVAFVVNPYDEFAIEEALEIKECLGGDIVVVSAGAAGAPGGLRPPPALGGGPAGVVRARPAPNGRFFSG